MTPAIMDSRYYGIGDASVAPTKIVFIVLALDKVDTINLSYNQTA